METIMSTTKNDHCGKYMIEYHFQCLHWNYHLHLIILVMYVLMLGAIIYGFS